MKSNEKSEMKMKSSSIYTADKKVNKSLQDRLRRDRISKSVKQLRELILGPSIEHAKIGKADVLKLTVQYIRNLKQKELTRNTSEELRSMQTYTRELNTSMKTPGQGHDNTVITPLPCSTPSRLETPKNNRPMAVNNSGNFKACYDENNVSNKRFFPAQSQSCPAKYRAVRSVPCVLRSEGGYQRRAPFRELNFNSKQVKRKQTIWRPW